MDAHDKKIDLAKHMKMSNQSTHLSNKLHALSNSDAGKLGGASDRLRGTEHFKKLKHETHAAFQAERKYNQSAEAKEHQKHLKTLSYKERQELRRKHR
jgi:hypothetical protein